MVVLGAARRGAEQRAAESQLHRAVNVPAQDPFDGRIARHDLGQPLAAPTPVFVDVGNPAREGRLVHHDDGRAVRLECQRAFEPRHGRIVHVAMAQARHGDVQADDPDRHIPPGNEVQRPALRQIAVIGKSRPECLALVVIARDDQERLPDLGQHLPRQLVLGGRTLIDHVTAQEHQIGPGRQAVQVADRRPEHRVGIHEPLVEHMAGPHMRIGVLGDEHGCLGAQQRRCTPPRPLSSSARWSMTTSTGPPGFAPAPGSTPTTLKPRLSCSRIEATLRASPTTAIICR